YTAAIYAARAALNPLIITGSQPGGQLMVTTDVENYPGFAAAIQGPWLMEQMHDQAKHVGAQIENDHIERVDFSSRPFKAFGESGKIYSGDTIIISTGAQAKWLGLESEMKFRGHGVSGCATCDGFFFKNKKVAVIGGGNAAIEEALYLTHHASEVTLIHRRDALRGEKILHQRLALNPKIKILWDSVVEEILGADNPKTVTGLKIKNVKTGAAQNIELDGVFIAIGHSPATKIFEGQIKLDKEGYIEVEPGTVKTNVPGVFAAGDVVDKVYRQAVTAAGLGCMAALDAEKFLSSEGAKILAA
ncbi:MAG: thioredoxin-disulfide reductase, partial [Dongiaceae bacterium]